MRNIKSFIYKRLSEDEELKGMVVGVYPNIAPREAGSPVVVYNRIVDDQNDIVRNSLYQISVRSNDLEKAELAKDRIVWLFSRYLSEGIRCSIQSINETYDHENGDRGLHITTKFKLVDPDF